MNKIKEILVGFFGKDETLWNALFNVVNTKGVSMALSSSEKSVNILNFPVASIKALKQNENVATLLSEIKKVDGVSFMINHDSEEHDTPLLSICPTGNAMSSKDKQEFFSEYITPKEQS